MHRCKGRGDNSTLVVAEAVFTHWVVRYGTPNTIHTDQGSNFESRLVYEICRIAGIQKTRTTPYHPQGNGQTERTNRSLLTMLRSFVQQARNDTWDEMLPWCLMAYRCTIHSSTGETLAMMTLGYDVRLPFDTQPPQSKQAMLEVNPFLARKMLLQKDTLQLTRQHLREQHINQARFYDREVFGAPFQPGDQVWLQNSTPTPGLSRKFADPGQDPLQ